MKFHLPKKLMVAVLAAMACVTAEAATMYPNEVLEIENGQTVTWTDYSNMQNGNAITPLVKDGEGTLKLEGLQGSSATGNYYKAPLVAREGTIDIVDSSICAHGAYTPNTGSANTWLMVGGKEAEMSIKNSSFNIATGESHMNVGTCDGCGTLTIDNSNVKLVGSLFMGIHEYATNADNWGLGYVTT